MTAAKHTPGPWHWPHDSNALCPVNPDYKVSAVSQILYADGGHGFLGRSNSDTLAELEADRRLIAAAPDLLAALERLLLSGDVRDAAEKSALTQARAAIAKATGGDA